MAGPACGRAAAGAAAAGLPERAGDAAQAAVERVVGDVGTDSTTAALSNGSVLGGTGGPARDSVADDDAQAVEALPRSADGQGSAGLQAGVVRRVLEAVPSGADPARARLAASSAVHGVLGQVDALVTAADGTKRDSGPPEGIRLVSESADLAPAGGIAARDLTDWPVTGELGRAVGSLRTGIRDRVAPPVAWARDSALPAAVLQGKRIGIFGWERGRPFRPSPARMSTAGRAPQPGRRWFRGNSRRGPFRGTPPGRNYGPTRTPSCRSRS